MLTMNNQVEIWCVASNAQNLLPNEILADLKFFLDSLKLFVLKSVFFDPFLAIYQELYVML